MCDECYFSTAEKLYSISITEDPNNKKANYNLGTLYYNRAVYLNKILEAKHDSLEKTGHGIEELNNEVQMYLSKAKPYFEKAKEIENNK